MGRLGAREGTTRLQAYGFRLTLAAVGVATGVAMLITIASLVESYRRHLNSGFESLGGGTVFVEALRPTYLAERMPRPLTSGDVEALTQTFAEHADVSAIYSITGQVAVCGQTVPVIIQGVDPQFAAVANAPSGIPRSLSDVDISEGLRTAVIGKAVSDSLRCPFVWQDLSISGRPFTVVGIMESSGVRSGVDYDSVVMIPATTFRHVYGPGVQVARIIISVRDVGVSHIRAVAEEILRSRHQLRETDSTDFRIYAPTEVVETSKRLARVLKSLAGVLLMSTVAVAMVGLLNSVMMGVKERTPEIGIRRVVGARRSGIATQFLTEGTLVGFAGSIWAWRREPASR
jgi:putative ABC transport system permease protein